MIKNTEDFNAVYESTFNRIVGWIENNEIALVTAFRGKKENVQNPELVKDDGKKIGDTYTHKENRERNRELTAYFLRLGYGVTSVKGVYIENYNTGSDRPSDEESLLVVNRNGDPDFYKNVFRMSEYYNQDCFCYKAKDDNVGYGVGTNACPYPGYNKKVRYGSFVKNISNEFMTRFKNKGFAFTDADPSELPAYDTSHSSRKADRIRKRVERSIHEEFDVFSNYSNGAKQAIAVIADQIIETLGHGSVQ